MVDKNLIMATGKTSVMYNTVPISKVHTYDCSAWTEVREMACGAAHCILLTGKW